MVRQAANELEWTLKSVGASFLVAMLATSVAVFLRSIGKWPFPPFSEFAVSGLAGAVAMYVLRPRRPFVVFSVFVPVMAAAALIATLLFYAYVMRVPTEF